VAINVDDKVRKGPEEKQRWPPRLMIRWVEGQRIHRSGHQGEGKGAGEHRGGYQVG
jgi:hypothetical protein